MKARSKRRPLDGAGRCPDGDFRRGKIGGPQEKKFCLEKDSTVGFWRNVDDVSLEKAANGMLIGKRPIHWDNVDRLKELMADGHWLYRDASGKVQNPNVQLQNEFRRRSTAAFQIGLVRQVAEWNTKLGRVREVERLVRMAEECKRGKYTVSEHCAMWQWECARYLFASNKLPEYWTIKAAGAEPEQNYGYHFLFDHPLFPVSAWLELRDAERKSLAANLVGDDDEAVRVIDLKEWWPNLSHGARKSYDLILNHDLKAGFEGAPKYPSVWELPHCPEQRGASCIMLRVDWTARRQTLIDHFIRELDKVRPERTERSLGRGPERDGKPFRGLASMWLDPFQFSPRELAGKVYPRPEAHRSKNGVHSDSVKEARKRAVKLSCQLQQEFHQSVPSAYIELRRSDDTFLRNLFDAASL